MRYILALLLMMPAMVYAQAPVSQPIIAEGKFAMQLVEALKLGTASNESQAIDILKSAGITPRDGWNTECPLTPKSVGEIRDSIIFSVAAGKVSMSREEALGAFRGVTEQYGLSVFPAPSERAEGGQQYAPPDLDEYYSRYGPPPVTYYPPPPEYGGMYAYNPYPFYSGGGFFPGFYTLGGFFGPGPAFFGSDRGFHRGFGKGFRNNPFLFGSFNNVPRIWDTPFPGSNLRFRPGIRRFGNERFLGFNRFNRFPGPGNTVIFGSRGFHGFNRFNGFNRFPGPGNTVIFGSSGFNRGFGFRGGGFGAGMNRFGGFAGQGSPRGFAGPGGFRGFGAGGGFRGGFGGGFGGFRGGGRR